MRKHIDIEADEADEADEPSEALVELFLSVQTWLTDYISTHVLQNYSELTVALQEAIRLYLKRKDRKGTFYNYPSKGDLYKVYKYLLLHNRISSNFIIESILTIKSIRSNSGILPISVALDGRQFSCSYNCSYCPNEPNMARSYLSSEGTFLRGAIQDFHIVEQVWRRLAELEVMGHSPDKLEIIALGGTFDCYPKEYRWLFSMSIFYACNMYSHLSLKFNGSLQHLLKKWVLTNPFLNNSPLDTEMVKQLLALRPMPDANDEAALKREQHLNTKAPCGRIIGLVLETRPDRINRFTMTEMRALGCTRVQLGIQTTDNNVLSYNSRGHTVEASIDANRKLRDNGFKVDGHLMPDLPGTTLEIDYQMVRDVFQGYDLQLDYAKIYPCLDLPFTQIRQWKETGEWQPIAETRFMEFIEFLGYTLSIVPPWTRINRVQRDFPEATEKNGYLGYVSDNIKTNLQQIVVKHMEQRGLGCYDIRSREIRNNLIDEQVDRAMLFIRSYRANFGTEYFISVEIPNKDRRCFDDCRLLGLCRLRIPDDTDGSVPHHYLPVYRQINRRIGRIRELHVYGKLNVNLNEPSTTQHRGIGKFLIRVAENLALTHECDMTTVISGVGVRDYYEHLGYTLDHRDDQFMTKDFNLRTARPSNVELFNKVYNWSFIKHAMTVKTSVHRYKNIQHGEAEGFAFSVIDEKDDYHPFKDSLFILCIALIIHCVFQLMKLAETMWF